MVCLNNECIITKPPFKIELSSTFEIIIDFRKLILQGVGIVVKLIYFTRCKPHI